MFTITVTTPCLITPPDPDFLINELHNDAPWKRGIGELLVKLGQKLIENNFHDEWLTMAQVAAFCRRYKLDWRGRSTRVKDLLLPVVDFFERHGDVMSCGVKVEAQPEWNKARRHQELRLRFRRMNPDGTCS
jgi:hypothetical protein